MPINTSTSTFFASARRRPSADLARDLSDAPRSALANTSASWQDQTRQAKWSTFSWKTRKRSPSDEGDLVPEGAGRRWLSDASRLSLAVAATCLGPFFDLVFPDQSRANARPLSKSSSSSQARILPTTAYRRWQNRAFRALLGLYLFYSLFLFTSRLFSLPLLPYANSRGATSHRRSVPNTQSEALEYTKWQQARFKLLDVYNVAADAIGSTALRIGKQSSKAAAGDFAGESNGANSLNNLMLLDRLPEVKRRWGETSKFAPSGSCL